MFFHSVTWGEIPQVAQRGHCKYFPARCCGNKQYAPSSSQKVHGTAICTLAGLPYPPLKLNTDVKDNLTFAKFGQNFSLRAQGGAGGAGRPHPTSPCLTVPHPTTALLWAQSCLFWSNDNPVDRVLACQAGENTQPLRWAGKRNEQ